MVNIHKIKQRAKEKGISVAFICSQLGLGRGYLNDVEKSSGTIPDDRLSKIAEMLETTLEYLKDETDEKEKPALDGEALWYYERFKRLPDADRRLVEEQIVFLEHRAKKRQE